MQSSYVCYKVLVTKKHFKTFQCDLYLKTDRYTARCYFLISGDQIPEADTAEKTNLVNLKFCVVLIL